MAQSHVDPVQLRWRRVVNFDSPVEDHGSYFSNRALVIPRLVRAISGGDYPWSAGGWTALAARGRIVRIARLQTLRLIVIAASLAHLTLLAADSFWRQWVEDRLDWFNAQIVKIGDNIPVIGEIWGEGENDLAVTAGMLGAILVPIVLMLAVERIARNLSFREI